MSLPLFVEVQLRQAATVYVTERAAPDASEKFQARLAESHQWLEAICDEAKRDVAALYDAASKNVDADGVPGETRSGLRASLRAVVQAMRAAAHERGAVDVVDELSAAFPKTAALVLARGTAPDPAQVERYVDDAVGIACELADEAAADGGEVEGRAMLAAQQWRGARVIVSEIVTAYEKSRRAAHGDLAKNYADGSYGFTVLEDEDALPADAQRATPKEEDKTQTVVLGLRWSALLDKRTCPRCRELDGKLTILAMPFTGPPLHANCRCVTSVWALGWEWTNS